MTRRHGSPLGGTAPRTPSPLPQESGGGGAEPVRVVQGFLANLPSRTRIFFERQFFANAPDPIQPAGASPFPRRVAIATIVAPKNQAIVLKGVSFNAYQASGIAVESISEVPSGRTVGTLAFGFSVGNRGLTDFQTNLPGTGTPVSYSTVNVVQGAGAAVGPRAGQGSLHQGTGSIAPESNWAAYVRPGEQIQAFAMVFRNPDFELRLLEVKMSGWLAAEKELDAILDRGWGG